MFRFTRVPGKVYFAAATEREPYQFWAFVHPSFSAKTFLS